MFVLRDRNAANRLLVLVAELTVSELKFFLGDSLSTLALLPLTVHIYVRLNTGHNRLDRQSFFIGKAASQARRQKRCHQINWAVKFAGNVTHELRPSFDFSTYIWCLCFIDFFMSVYSFGCRSICWTRWCGRCDLLSNPHTVHSEDFPAFLKYCQTFGDCDDKFSCLVPASLHNTQYNIHCS